MPLSEQPRRSMRAKGLLPVWALAVFLAARPAAAAVSETVGTRLTDPNAQYALFGWRTIARIVILGVLLVLAWPHLMDLLARLSAVGRAEDEPPRSHRLPPPRPERPREPQPQVAPPREIRVQDSYREMIGPFDVPLRSDSPASSIPPSPGNGR